MAGRTTAQTKALVAKALKAGSKSAGMRDLFDAGLSTVEIKEAFDAPYGFVYGVGVRSGHIVPEVREAKPKAAKAAPMKAAKANGKAGAAKPAAKRGRPKKA